MIAHENELEEICKSNLKEKKKKNLKYEQTPYFFYDLHSRARGVLRPIKWYHMGMNLTQYCNGIRNSKSMQMENWPFSTVSLSIIALDEASKERLVIKIRNILILFSFWWVKILAIALLRKALCFWALKSLFLPHLLPLQEKGIQSLHL